MSRRRPVNSRDNGDDDGEDDHPKKRLRPDGPPNFVPDLRFACPYLKKDPKNTQLKPSCLQSGFPDIHRLKDHIYKYHKQPIYCPKCKETFDSRSDCDAHIEADHCQKRENVAFPGINSDQEKKLRDRMRIGKRSAYKTEKEKWIEIWKIIFPNDIDNIPSPYHVQRQQINQLTRFYRFALVNFERHTRPLLQEELVKHGPEILHIIREVLGQVYNEYVSEIWQNPETSSPTSSDHQNGNELRTMNTTNSTETIRETIEPIQISRPLDLSQNNIYEQRVAPSSSTKLFHPLHMFYSLKKQGLELSIPTPSFTNAQSSADTKMPSLKQNHVNETGLVPSVSRPSPTATRMSSLIQNDMKKQDVVTLSSAQSSTDTSTSPFDDVQKEVLASQSSVPTEFTFKSQVDKSDLQNTSIEPSRFISSGEDGNQLAFSLANPFLGCDSQPQQNGEDDICLPEPLFDEEIFKEIIREIEANDAGWSPENMRLL
ncbi:hypothetical protein, variant [Verruconis gallopava]|uniref:C2H2-type domain-containing protein n=1 Tax=Verruconis gallopava TaxID=253628 RepID=A0A0D2A508_9PEZI|nr:hypothetical protein, variant [Verruconis gallopava]KIW01565.1 hypothetical protein, variant [Verruconis gallopava]